jgi:soluble lytic murein transglycosylase-like protein
MEEISLSWSYSDRSARNPYVRMFYLLLVFSLVFLLNVQSAPAAGPEEESSSATQAFPQFTTLASAHVPITPVRKSKSDRFNPMIARAADRYEVDPALIKAVIMAESAYNPKAVSKQGAKGLMQLMPGTARALGVKNAFNPVHNINGGVKYLRQLLDTFKDNVKLALAAYNAGAGKVKKHGGVPPIKATRHYVRKVFAYYLHYKAEMTEKTENV